MTYGRDGMVIRSGAGGLMFARCESNLPAGRSLLLDQITTPGGYTAPTHIAFRDCLFERSSSATQPAALIAHGENILFDHCVFQHSGSWNGALLLMNDSNFDITRITIDCPAGVISVPGQIRLGAGVAKLTPATAFNRAPFSSTFSAFNADVPTGYSLGASAWGDATTRWAVRADGQIEWGGGGTRDVILSRLAAGVLKTDGKLLAALGLGVGNSAAASALGTLSKKMEVFDASGNSLGFVPIYTTIT